MVGVKCAETFSPEIIYSHKRARASVSSRQLRHLGFFCFQACSPVVINLQQSEYCFIFSRKCYHLVLAYKRVTEFKYTRILFSFSSVPEESQNIMGIGMDSQNGQTSSQSKDLISFPCLTISGSMPGLFLMKEWKITFHPSMISRAERPNTNSKFSERPNSVLGKNGSELIVPSEYEF